MTKRSLRRRLRRGRAAVIAIPYLWLLVFFLLPFLVVMKISVSEMDGATFQDLVRLQDGSIAFNLKFVNYLLLVQDDLYFSTYLSSLKYAAVTTVACLFIGYPFAYFMARARTTLQPALLMLVMLPFWTSFLLRVYAWKGLLTENGWAANAISWLGLDQVLAAVGLIPAPGQLMNTPFSLVLGMTYTYLPFMILPLYGSLSRLDASLVEAAADLGAKPLTALFRVVVPLSAPGIRAGSILVFIPCVGAFLTPDLLGGGKTVMIGNLVQNQFTTARDWPFGSAVSLLLMLIVVLLVVVFLRREDEEAL